MNQQELLYAYSSVARTTGSDLNGTYLKLKTPETLKQFQVAIPAKAGIQWKKALVLLDSRVRGNDEKR